jgi:protein LSM14
VAAAMAKLGQPQQQAPVPHTNDSADNLTQKVNQMRIHENQQRGRGRGRGGPRGGRRESALAPKSVEVPKEDYDFESANAKFKKEDLVKEAGGVATGSPITSPTNKGEASNPMENGHTEKEGEDGDVVIPAKPETYNKKSSFFDNISSDLKDRMDAQSGQGGVDGRAMRREERTRNMETFGQGSVDGGYRGGFRGRGRGRGFRGGGGGGGYRGRGRGGVPSIA